MLLQLPDEGAAPVGETDGCPRRRGGIAADAEPAGDAGDGRLHGLKLARDVGEVLFASREEQHHGKFAHGEKVFTGLDDGGNDAKKLFGFHGQTYIQLVAYCQYVMA